MGAFMLPQGGDRAVQGAESGAVQGRRRTREDHPGRRGPLPDHPHRREPGRKIGTRARRLPPSKCRRLRLGAIADAWDPQGGDRASAKGLLGRQAGEPEATETVHGTIGLHP
jgi:hypothetical protein